MITKRAAELPATPTEYALKELPARVVIFLHAVSRHASIRFAMEAGGYGAADHEEGLRLLAAACRYREGGLDPTQDQPARAAGAELEAWTRTHVPRLRAALERLHPAQAHWFAALDPARPDAALVGLATLLDHLRNAEQRHRQAPALQTLAPALRTLAPALRTLAQRGLDSTERKRLSTLLETARRAEASARPPAPNNDHDTDPDLIALSHWYSDWSATARALVKRKDWLIWLGLSRQRREKSASGLSE